MSLPFPLDGTTLVVGPSNVGKTRLTARALEAWVDDYGPGGVVVLDFAPVVERDGVVLGGHLTQFTEIPDAASHGVFDAHAPRSEGADEDEAMGLAAANAETALELLDAAPADPTVVLINDSTIALQADPDLTARLTGYCDRADCAVLNAFESDELGVEHPVSENERAALDALRSWAGRVVELP